MTSSFKSSITILFAILLLNQICTANEAKDSSVWQQLKTVHFGQRFIRENASDLLFVEIPDKIEDAAVMPITIKSLAAQIPDHYIRILYLIIDNNPEPYSAVFHLSPMLGSINLSTRIRMENFSDVRVIAELNDDSLHMVKKFVAASGGCSAPVSKDPTTTLKRLGKIQIRIRNPTIGQQTTVQAIVSHPNNNGLQFNNATRDYIPAHYVTNIDIRFSGQQLISTETGISLSENPSIRFDFTPSTTGILKVTATDNKQAVYFAEKQLK